MKMVKVSLKALAESPKNSKTEVDSAYRVIGGEAVADGIKQLKEMCKTIINNGTVRVKQAEKITKDLAKKYNAFDIELDTGIRTQRVDANLSVPYIFFYARIHLTDPNSPVPTNSNDYVTDPKKRDKLTKEITKLNKENAKYDIHIDYDVSIIRVYVEIK